MGLGGQDGLLLHRLLRGLLLFSLGDRGGLLPPGDGRGGGGGFSLLLQQTFPGAGGPVLLLIAHPHLGGVAAKAQKSGLGPLDHLNGHVVPLQTELKQSGGYGVLLRTPGGLDPL